MIILGGLRLSRLQSLCFFICLLLFSAQCHHGKPSGAAEAEWERIRSSTSPSSYQAFIKRYPDSKHRSEALERVAALEKEAWKEAQWRDTALAYENFVKDFPGSKNAQLAEEASTGLGHPSRV
jgi:hypothetical protein